MVRNLVVGVGVAVMLVSCGSDSAESEPFATTAVESTVVSTTTSVAPSSTTLAASSTTLVPETTTTMLSYELGVSAAPADGQWFAELPIPWVFALSPDQEDPPRDADSVPGAMGRVRQEAIVTVNGLPTDGESLKWWTAHGVGDPNDWDVGENRVVFEAAFRDGTVTREERVFYYDPTLDAFTGWMVALDTDNQSITFAASTYESAEEDGADTGLVTSVVAYPVRDDAAFILLDVDSSGQPPPSTMGFNEFADLVTRAHAGDCDRCFYASFSDLFAEPGAEYGAEYFVIYLKDGEIQQLEQIWSP